MSPSPTTIMLNSAAQHSVTYDASNDSLTANLPTSTPIERVPNKQKMMILIYFVQRDFERRKAPRKIDSEISLELRIVERIIGQFSNHAQGLRTLKEYTKVGDHVDTSVGMERNRTAPDENGKGTKSIQMTITKEVRDVIMEWLQDMLAPADDWKRPTRQSRKSDGSTKRGTSELIDLSSPTPEVIEIEDDIRPSPPPPKKQRLVKPVGKFAGKPILSASSPPNSPHLQTSSRPSTAHETFPKLFPTSPFDGAATGTSSPPKEPPRSVGDNQDKSNVTSPRRANSSYNSPVDGIASQGSANSESFEATDTKEDEATYLREGETVADVNVILGKVRQYALHLFKHARTPDGEYGVRKYSRKLRRLTNTFPNV